MTADGGWQRAVRPCGGRYGVIDVNTLEHTVPRPVDALFNHSGSFI